MDVDRTRSTSRRSPSILTAFFLVAAILTVSAPAAVGVVNTCRATNVRKGTPSSSNLQAVIKDAGSGDTIAVKYVCVGSFTIGKNLTLVGKAAPGASKATLHANGYGRVLRVSARVRLINLKIMGGSVTKSASGGGIYNSGTLTLKDTVVRGNTAAKLGGGIYSDVGSTVTMNGASSVSGNTAGEYGGGIYNHYGTLILNDTSSVSENEGHQAGGIYGLYGSLTMNDASSVSGNTTSGIGIYGGGILANGSTITMNDSSSVSGNTAQQGAGVSIGLGTLTMNGSSSVSGNTASSYGGGVRNSGTITMNGTSSIVGNTGFYGGGIYDSGILIMNGLSSIADNAATGYGGGVAIWYGGTATMNDSSSVSGNTADAGDIGGETGGGYYVVCGVTLTGAVDGGNVHDNHRGTASPVLDNITFVAPCA